MTWNLLNLVVNLPGRILYAIFYTLLLFPWGQKILNLTEIYLPPLQMGLIFWSALMIGSFLITIVQELDFSFITRVIVVAGFLISNIVLSGFYGIFDLSLKDFSITNLIVCLFLTGIFQVIGFRFERLISREVDFYAELNLTIIFMLFTLFFKNQFSLIFSIEGVLAFFLSGAAFAIYLKYTDMKQITGSNFKPVGVIILTVVFFISFFSLIFTYGVNEKVFNLILLPFNFISNLIYEVFLKILLVVLIILSPIINLLIKFLRSLMILKPNGTENESAPDVLENLQNNMENVEQFVDLSWLLRIIICVLAILLIFYLVKRYYKSQKGVSGYEEIRESVFDFDDLKNDFLRFVKSLMAVRKKTKSHQWIYDRTGLVIKIREIYYRFLKEFNQIIPFKKYFTPREYQGNILHHIPIDEVVELTSIYEKARYGEEVKLEDYTKMQHAFTEIMNFELTGVEDKTKTIEDSDKQK